MCVSVLLTSWTKQQAVCARHSLSTSTERGCFSRVRLTRTRSRFRRSGYTSATSSDILSALSLVSPPMLSPICVVTSLCCHQSVLSLIYAVTSLPCHLSRLSPVYIVTILCCQLSVLSPVFAVTTPLFHKFMLLPIYVVTSLWCHHSTLSPLYVVTILCYHNSMLSPLYIVATMLSPLLCCHQSMLSPVYDIINRCFNTVTVYVLWSQQLLCLLLAVCLFVCSLSETPVHLSRPALRSLLSVCSLEWALCPGVLAWQ